MSTAIHVIPEPLPTTTETRIAAYLLADYLERLGVEVVFGLTGHTVIGMLDALGRSRIRYVSTRHEQVAAHAADGYARAAGKPGVLLTHLGPGLTNAATGVANAALDSIPMVVIAGDVQSYFHGRHPHQEVNLHQDADQYQIYRPFCKRVYRVEQARDLPRIVERAFHLAQTGRPGPVLVDVPMDVFSSSLPVDAFAKVPAEIARPSIDPATAERIVAALAEAERPVLYAGGGVLSARASAELAALAEALELPIAHSLMGKGVVREDHPLLLGMTGFWGTPIANEKCRTADLILAIGTRFAEANSSSWDPRFTFSIPPARLIHIDADVAEIGRNFPTELGVVADAKLALAALGEAARGVKHRNRGSLRLDIAQGRRAFAANWADQYSSAQFPMRPERILSELRKAVPEDGYIVTDVGWNKNGVGQQFPITVPGTFITPSGLATMGFGPAAALGVKLAQPDRAVVALVGDGAFGSNPSVVATAMEAGLGVVWLVMDNAAFGTIAGLTNMHYGWEFGCLFEADGARYRTDFAQIAKGYGADGVFIRSADELGPALASALASGRPTVIQAPMENAPTPTPGHWDINCVYRKGS
ncbi:MAG TPA: thiamine pyrophosphate-binding protein [Vicinamibacterales bacterium]|nr:thiamine pyrophosphate-binding protein [Vicinamibacterales bacterium]